jgi:penicillin-binding protein 2
MINILSEQLIRPKKSKKRGAINRIGFKKSIIGYGSQSVVDNNAQFWNSALFSILVLLVFFVFVAKAFNLQILHGRENFDLAEGNRVRAVNVMAERGLITDKNGETLVRNKPAFSVLFDNEKCSMDEGVDVCFGRVQAFTNDFKLAADLPKIHSDMEKGKGDIVVKTNLSKEDLLPIEVRLGELPLFSVSISPVRDYLFSDAFSHLIGYVGFAETTTAPKIEGKIGIEKHYNDVLSGVDGGEIFQVDSAGHKIDVLSERRAVPGGQIGLYADRGLQTKAFDEVKKLVDGGDATAGVVVAQDPRNGGILALVSYPAFDPNKISSGLTQAEFDAISKDKSFPFFNRVISATYPPGSVFKMVMAAAALMEGVIDPAYQIFDNGFIQIGAYIFRNWNTGGHGLVDMRRALQVSNDTYFYTVGGGYNEIGGLGIDRINKWAGKFGLGALTGIDVPGEVSGFVPNSQYKDWYLGDTYITSIGQGDMLVTPLQLNNITSFYANGGILWRPSVVESVDGQPREPIVLAKDFVNKQDFDVVREGLKMAVEPGGTGYPFFDFPDKYGVEVAGKTGTAEFGVQGEYETHAWFTVYGPYNEVDTPRGPIALTVFLEGGGGGADKAAPVARQLFDYWFGK